MGTDAISPLRQRMIEDMSARQLHATTQKNHIRACKRFATFLKRSPDTGSGGCGHLLTAFPPNGYRLCDRVTRRRPSGIPGWVSRVQPRPHSLLPQLGSLPRQQQGRRRIAVSESLTFTSRYPRCRAPPEGRAP